MRWFPLTFLLLIPCSLNGQGGIASVKLEPTPLIARTATGERQVVLAEIESEGLKDASFRLNRPDWPKPIEIHTGEVAKGKQVIRLRLPVPLADQMLRASFEAGGERRDLPEILVSPPRKWSVYLVQHSHTDIGYTRPQTEILPEHLRYIDYALDFCDLTDSYPDDARFRWTCEISWAVREYLRRRPAAQVDRLKRRVAEGRIEIAGMFLNMSEIADEAALAASMQPLREIEEVLGKTVRTAMQNDVNGAAWCLPDYFTGLGIRYLTMGINKTRSILPFDKPTAFWWESPSGKRILAFRPDHYMTGNSWQIHEGKPELMEPGLGRYLNGLAQAKYPFDRIAVQFSGYSTDNSPPARKECDLVKAWNETYAWPKLRIATAHEFLEFMEKNHAQELEVHRQAWPDWWTDGFGSAARETAASRETHAGMQVNEGLLAMASLLGEQASPSATARSASIHEALLFYDEHTFGAAESISHPGAQNSMVQWGEKSSYVWEAVKNAGLLREEALGLLQVFVPRSDSAVVAVYNTLGHARSGGIEVFVDHEILPKDQRFRIVDSASGEEVPAQIMRSRAEGSYWTFWVKDVPPLGFNSYRIHVLPEKEVHQAPNPAGAAILENDYYRIELGSQTGAVVSLRDKQSGLELVDPRAEWQLGQLFYERAQDRGDFDKPSFPSNHPFKRSPLRNVRIGPVTHGPIWQSVEITAEMDGVVAPAGVHAEIRLYQTTKRVEWHFTIHKAPITDPEAVYVAFPFNMPGGKIVYEGQGGLVTPGEGQLPGSSSDWQTIQSFLALRNREGQILLSSPEVPLVQLGEINLGKWQPVTVVAKPYVYSWVMNNYWFTNFRAAQEGEFRWSYALTSGADTSNTAATEFGWNTTVPLVARVLPPGTPGKGAASLSTLRISDPAIKLVSSRLSRGGNGIILHLREVAGKAGMVQVSPAAPGIEIESVSEVSALETPLKEGLTEISFTPFEVKFLKIQTRQVRGRP